MGGLRAFLEDEKEYFATCKDMITAQNNRMLADACVVYALVLAFYTCLSVVTRQPPLLTNMYYAFDGVHALLCVAVLARPARWKKDFAATQTFCALLEITLLGFFALEGAFVSRTQHSLYVPIAIILAQIFFVRGTGYAALSIFAYCASFACLSYLHKEPQAYINDAYIAVASFLSAGIGYFLIAKLRHGEGKALVQYEKLSRTDLLTGLDNKSAVEQLCKRYLARDGRACAFLILDMDDFKQINDRFGHEAGDDVLAKVGEALKGALGPDDIVGRFGGDEFVALIDGCDGPDSARETMERLAGAASRIRFAQPEIQARYSAGVALRRREDDYRSLFARADRALYAAKDEGKGGLRIE